MEESIAVRARIAGKVQGVWYRQWTTEAAAELGLTGWVRNRSDGTVEACFSGPPKQVQLMLQRCEEGPPKAEVTEVTHEPCPTPSLQVFQRLPTH